MAGARTKVRATNCARCLTYPHWPLGGRVCVPRPFRLKAVLRANHWHLPPGHLAAINILITESYSASETFLRRSFEPCDGGCPMSVLCAMTISSFGKTVMYCPPAPIPVYAPSKGPGEFGASPPHHI